MQADQAREKPRITFRDYASGYLEWAKLQKRSWTTEQAQLSTLLPRFGDRKLDEISSADVERVRDRLAERPARATVNRYLALLSGAHLTPNRLHEAAERLVPNGSTELARN